MPLPKGDHSDQPEGETSAPEPNQASSIPGPPLPTPSGVEARLTVARRSHVGRVRTRNEDSVWAFTSLSGGAVEQLPFGLYIVADGMGGHRDGHEASRQATQIVTHDVLTALYLPLLEGAGAPTKPVAEIMVEAIQRANTTVYNPDPARDGGTTLTSVILFGRRLYLAHVGDSRAYLWSEGSLRCLTNDHTYVWRLIEAGQLTPEEAASHPHRSVLYRAVGQGQELEVETFTCKLPASGQLLLCSDGLSDLVSDEGLTAVLSGDGSPTEKADLLVAEALDQGGSDNISLLVVDFAF